MADHEFVSDASRVVVFVCCVSRFVALKDTTVHPSARVRPTDRPTNRTSVLLGADSY